MLSKSCQCEKRTCTLCFCLPQNSRNINQSKEASRRVGVGNGMMWTVRGT